MTTLRDYLHDLAIEVIKKTKDYNFEQIRMVVVSPPDEQIDELVDEAITNIKTRLIGEV